MFFGTSQPMQAIMNSKRLSQELMDLRSNNEAILLGTNVAPECDQADLSTRFFPCNGKMLSNGTPFKTTSIQKTLSHDERHLLRLCPARNFKQCKPSSANCAQLFFRKGSQSHVMNTG